jgi:hypothetical protein
MFPEGGESESVPLEQSQLGFGGITSQEDRTARNEGVNVGLSCSTWLECIWNWG